MKAPLIRILFVLAATALAACGGGIPLEDLGEEVIDAICARQVRCGAYVDLATCRAQLTDFDSTQLERSIEAGRASYDEDDAEACVEALRDASCDQTSEEARTSLDACDSAVTGRVDDGGTCWANEECRSGDCVEPVDCAMACCMGTCAATAPTPGIGEACPQGDCVDGAYCDLQLGTCHALKPAGQPCRFDGECGYGLLCAGPIDARTCVDAPDRGQPCPDGECASIGDRCDQGTLVCAALGDPGAACTSGGDCKDPLICDPMRGCQPPPAVGQPCEFRCADGAFCNASSVCEAARPNGQTCISEIECQSHYCDETPAVPVCADRPICG